MKPLLELFESQPIHERKAGELVIQEDKFSYAIFVLIEGSLEILKDGVLITTLSEPGAIVGEMSVLLDIPNTATVRARRDSRFYIARSDTIFEHPDILRCVSAQLARRLHMVNQLVALWRKERQSEATASRHLSKVGKVVETTS